MEYAIVFPVFFMLLYAIICYGLTFLVSASMQSAAEDGARAALRYQDDRANRLSAARSVVIEKLSWLPSALKPSVGAIHVRICQASNLDNCSTTLTCSAEPERRCMVRLDFSIPYGTAPLAPGLRLAGMDMLNPAELAASASILVDRGGL